MDFNSYKKYINNTPKHLMLRCLSTWNDLSEMMELEQVPSYLALNIELESVGLAMCINPDKIDQLHELGYVKSEFLALQFNHLMTKYFNVCAELGLAITTEGFLVKADEIARLVKANVASKVTNSFIEQEFYEMIVGGVPAYDIILGGIDLFPIVAQVAIKHQNSN